jgi:cupin superfamily acireductone dioxygenase involved in methionine salvage
MNTLDNIMRKSINIMVENSLSEKTIKKFTKKHNSKIHFIPIKYRVFGGIMQSLNIRFGNFIEEAIHQILLANNDNEILEEYSGKRSNSFCISVATEELIDQYITNCETNTYTEEELKENYNKLLDQIMINESNKNCNVIKFKHDVDILFKDKNENIIYYVETKYNDDHDTGKFVDINRKLLKTYAYLVRELGIYDKNKFKPMLFYFTNKRMKGNIYIPENETIYRGSRFFEKFTNIRYDELENYMLNISEEEQTIKQFDNMYNKIVKEKEYKYDDKVNIYSIKEDSIDEYTNDIVK